MIEGAAPADRHDDARYQQRRQAGSGRVVGPVGCVRDLVEPGDGLRPARQWQRHVPELPWATTTGVLGTMSIVAGDFNGDGKMDVATGNRSIVIDDSDLGHMLWDSITVLPGDGTGRLIAPRPSCSAWWRASSAASSTQFTSKVAPPAEHVGLERRRAHRSDWLARRDSAEPAGGTQPPAGRVRGRRLHRFPLRRQHLPPRSGAGSRQSLGHLHVARRGRQRPQHPAGRPDGSCPGTPHLPPDRGRRARGRVERHDHRLRRAGRRTVPRASPRWSRSWGGVPATIAWSVADARCR